MARVSNIKWNGMIRMHMHTALAACFLLCGALRMPACVSLREDPGIMHRLGQLGCEVLTAMHRYTVGVGASRTWRTFPAFAALRNCCAGVLIMGSSVCRSYRRGLSISKFCGMRSVGRHSEPTLSLHLHHRRDTFQLMLWYHRRHEATGILECGRALHSCSSSTVVYALMNVAELHQRLQPVLSCSHIRSWRCHGRCGSRFVPCMHASSAAEET